MTLENIEISIEAEASFLFSRVRVESKWDQVQVIPLYPDFRRPFGQIKEISQNKIDCTEAAYENQ